MKLCEYAAQRDDILRRITAALDADERISAAWLLGSFGRGEADEWSDLDLHVAVRDDALETLLDNRMAFYLVAGEPVLIQGDMPSDSQAEARFQARDVCRPRGGGLEHRSCRARHRRHQFCFHFVRT